MASGYLFIIIVALLIPTIASIRLKLTSMACNSGDETFMSFPTCRIKAVSRYVQRMGFSIKFHQLPVTSFVGHYRVMVRANGYKPFLYNFKLNCDFTKHLNPVSNLLFTLFKTTSNLNHSCPFVEDFAMLMENRHLEDLLKNLPVPLSDYALFSDFTFYNKYKASVNVFATVF